MSRIGNMPIQIPKDVVFETRGSRVSIKGPKGELELEIPRGITLRQTNLHVVISAERTDRPTRAIHGFVRAQLANHITGVIDGWERILELSGVGYRAVIAGANLQLTVGFSHPVTVVPPSGITFSIREGKIVISGIDRQLVGEVAAKIRAIKKPEPYKGKGIKYEGEKIRKKAGKAKAVGAPGGK